MPFPGEPVFPRHDEYPCTKDCPDRTWDCHGKCKRYLDARAKNEKERQGIKHRSKGQDDYDDYKNNSIARTYARSHRRK